MLYSLGFGPKLINLQYQGKEEIKYLGEDANLALVLRRIDFVPVEPQLSQS